MSRANFNDIWRIMKIYNFDVDGIDSDMRCIICKGILINACNGPCGCRYCMECIVKYLNNEEKTCPGNSEYCEIEIIDINKNVQIDQAINRRISMIVVKCPGGDCQFKDELKKIEDHIRVCDIKPTNCPYFKIGCKEQKISNENMKDHLSFEVVMHSELLFEWVNNIENEMESLKKCFIKLKDQSNHLEKEIEIVKLKNDSNEKTFNEIQKVEEAKMTKIGQLSVEIRSIKTELEALTFKKEKKQLIQTEELEKIKLKFQQGESRLTEIEESAKNGKEEISTIRNEMINITSALEKMSNEASQNLKYIEANSVNLESKIINIEANKKKSSRGEFVWVIDNYLEKTKKAKMRIDEEIHSDAFFSHKNGYKMCLCVCLNGNEIGRGTHLSVGFCLMRGSFDNSLKWPFKHDVIIELINQQTGMSDTSHTIKYEYNPHSPAWKKPSGERNNEIYNDLFVKLTKLSENKALCKDDRILIKCTVQFSK